MEEDVEVSGAMLLAGFAVLRASAIGAVPDGELVLLEKGGGAEKVVADVFRAMLDAR